MSTPSLRFLLDENVRVELARFLKAGGVDVKVALRSSLDPFLARLSKKEERVVVSNDWDFCEFTREEIFSVIWLRIPQNDPEALVTSFGRLLSHFPSFPGRLFILRPGDWDDLPLARLLESAPRTKKSS